MSQKDGSLANESNFTGEESYSGENRAIYSQDFVGNRNLNSGESVINKVGPKLNDSNWAMSNSPQKSSLNNPHGSVLNNPQTPGINSQHRTTLNSMPGLTLNSGRPQINSAGPPIHSGGPPINSGGPPINSGGPPINSGGPPINSGGSPINSGGPPIKSGGPLINSGGPQISSGGPPISSGGPPISSGGPPISSGGPPISSGGPPMNTGGHPINTGGPPLHTGGPSTNTGGPPINSGGPLINSRGPPINTGISPINDGGPPIHTGFSLINSGGSPMHSGRPPVTSVSSPINSGGPPITSIGPPRMYSGGPPINSAGPPINSGGPPMNSGGPPMNSGGPPMSSGGPPMNSGGPPMSSGGPPMNSGGPPMSSGGPPMNSGGPPMNSGGHLTNSAGLPMNSGGPPINSRGPQINSGGYSINRSSLNAGPPLTNIGMPPLKSMGSTSNSSLSTLNSSPHLNKTDVTQAISHQFQNVNLSPTVPPQGYNKMDLASNTMPPTNSQSYSTTNRPLDMRHPNYSNLSPYNNQMNNQNINVTKTGYNANWGMDSVDLLQCRNVLPPEKVMPPKIKLHQEMLDRVNCSPEIFRCTLTKIPESHSLLQKSRLPLGILIHPFKDLNHLSVIQCSSIVRCRSCRTYINPFVYFVDSKRWKCNLCFKVNELPEEFQFDPATKSFGDPSRRPEIRTSTIEFIAPSEYMVRPPQPAVYLFLFDVSRLAIESGYLSIVCNIIADEISNLPRDGRTQVGILAVNSAIHFFSMQENMSQPHQMIMLDVDDVFLPCPDLIVNLKEKEELIKDLLSQLPYMFNNSYDNNCALGAALQAAYQLLAPSGGRITIFQLCLPNIGPGALQAREDPNTRSGKDVPYLNPITDFYKRLALDCSGQQIAVDLFLLNCQYSDLASLSGVSKFSGGCIYYLPLFHASKIQLVESLDKMLRRYLTRKIGFEAVMRIRCTRGLSVHTFHGNFYVRSTDLLSLPNINPDAGFGIQVTIEENLSDMQNVCFQVALLYTSYKGERKIRVHTLCLPISSNLLEILHSADQQCIIGLLAKMAVDRSLQSSLSDAREALINAGIDALSTYKVMQSHLGNGLMAPHNLKLLPLYIIALLKCRALRYGVSTRLDDRIFAMCQLKTLPLTQLIQMIYPDLYPLLAYLKKPINDIDDEFTSQPDRLHLSAEKLDSRDAFLLNAGDQIFLYVGKNIHPSFCYNVLGISNFSAIPEEMYELPELSTPESEKLRSFIATLQDEKPYYATLQVIRDDSHFSTQFTERLIEDRFENALSYHEFLQHLKTQVK